VCHFGDAKRAMNMSLVAAFVNLVPNAMLIFGLRMGIAGADPAPGFTVCRDFYLCVS